jgi:hypothetical protein
MYFLTTHTTLQKIKIHAMGKEINCNESKSSTGKRHIHNKRQNSKLKVLTHPKSTRRTTSASYPKKNKVLTRASFDTVLGHIQSS